MQFLIDTATDSPTELYKIGRFLTDQFAATPNDDNRANTPAEAVVIREALELSARAMDAMIAPPPPAPDYAAIVSDSDVEVEIDDAGNIASVAAVVALPAAPPPPPAAAPLPAAPPAPPGPPAAPEYDVKGMPWDGRIHASNRAKKIDLSWKNRRGVDAALVAAVEAQNKPGNAPTTVANSPVAPAAPHAIPSATLAPPPPAPPAPAALSTVTPSVPPSTASVAPDFRGLMMKIGQATAAGKLTHERVNEILAGVGLKPEEMAQLINNPPLIASVNAAVEAALT